MDAVAPAQLGFEPDLKTPTGLLGALPAWGSSIYSNYILPALSPGPGWLNGNTPFSGGAAPASSASAPTDYFSSDWSSAPMQTPQPQPFALGQPGPSAYYSQPTGGYIFDPAATAAISTALLVNPVSGVPGPAQQQQQQQQHQRTAAPSTISPSVELVDAIASPLPLHSLANSPALAPRLGPARGSGSSMGAASASAAGAGAPFMSRQVSVDSDADGEHEPELEHMSHSEHEHDEGVERDGMIWGMKVDDYRALSARERKRVRNRISARTFRAKRKEHLNSLEHTLNSKDLQVRLAHEETDRLRREIMDLRRRLAKYEKVYDLPA
ncbi:hypothetical protein Q5752_005531 [Cryptotrichosporon argae]